jgi:hypothetical protein
MRVLVTAAGGCVGQRLVARPRCNWMLPVLHASLGEVVAAIARMHGPEVLQRVRYEPNAALQARFANYRRCAHRPPRRRGAGMTATLKP